MRRPTLALSTAVLSIALAASVIRAQQSPGGLRPRANDTPAAAPDALSAARGARQLLRNGLDYNTYGEYERALEFLREAESRQYELSLAERKKLHQGIADAQRGLRKTDNDPVALTRRSSARPPAGAIALSPSARPEIPPLPHDEIQLTSATEERPVPAVAETGIPLVQETPVPAVAEMPVPGGRGRSGSGASRKRRSRSRTLRFWLSRKWESRSFRKHRSRTVRRTSRSRPRCPRCPAGRSVRPHPPRP